MSSLLLSTDIELSTLVQELQQSPDLPDICFELGSQISASGAPGCLDKAVTFWAKALDMRPGWPKTNPEWAHSLHTIALYMLSKGSTHFASAMELIGKMLEVEAAAAKEHPLGKHNFRFLNNRNIPRDLGHLCLEPDLVVKMRALGWIADTHFMLLVPGRVSNETLLRYWERYIEVIRNPQHVEQLSQLRDALRIETHYARLPDGIVAPLGYASARVQREWAAQNGPPIFQLTDQDRERGRRKLLEMGVPSNSWFVAIHARELGFHNETPDSPTGRFRNADINSYSKAIKHIVDAGGWVIRLGDPSMSPLHPHPHTIDYARSEHKSDWMDVFLCAEARFFVGTSSGLTHVANLFGTPCALVNWCSTTLPCFPTDLFIPKMVLSKPLKRPLSFSEQFSEPYVSQLDTKLAEFGFAPQDNSPDEILELVKEMFETLETTVSYHQDDLYLQHRAQQSFETPFTSWSGCRVGRDFLRRHPELVSPQRELRML